MRLELNDERIAERATPSDIAAAVEREARDVGWALVLEDDDRELWAEISSAGRMHLECWDGEGAFTATQDLSSTELVELFASFLHDNDRWRRQIDWTRSAIDVSKADVKTTRRLQMPRLGAPAIAVILFFAVLVVSFNLSQDWVVEHLPPALQGRAAWMVLLFAIGVPVLLSVAVLAKMSQARAAAHWPQTQGRITRSETVAAQARHAAPSTRRLVIHYEYEVGGQRHQGERVGIGEVVAGDARIPELLKRYRLNARVPVYYDPKSPGKAVLERELPQEFAQVFWIIALVAVLICIGLAGWLVPDFLSNVLTPHLGPTAKPHLLLFCGVLVVANLIWFLTPSRETSKAGKQAATGSGWGALIWIVAIAALAWYASGY